VNQHVCEIRTKRGKLDPSYLSSYLLSTQGQRQIDSFQAGGNRQGLNYSQIRSFVIPYPSPDEQVTISEVLNDAAAALFAIDMVIAKKRAIRRAAMQQLLSRRLRLPGFSGPGHTQTVRKVADCLDALRVPLNESQRATMEGPYPYCGANGVLDHINNYVLDDDVILIAEDGGYFDEYEYRPIAYRMSGRIWVNNHAHILKAKTGVDQDFLFYTLVHRNVLPYLASGTRAKLNKAEMNKIEVSLPEDEHEQKAISTLLSDLDVEIEALASRRVKMDDVKVGIMQSLLSGRVRLKTTKATA